MKYCPFCNVGSLDGYAHRGNCATFPSNTPTPKQGPPTKRECRELLKTEAENCGNCAGRGKTWPRVNQDEGDDCLVCYGFRNMLVRLTDEALDLDEKRVAALELVNKNVGWLRDAVKDGTIAKEDIHKSALWKILIGASEYLDALTPATQEENKP